MGIREIVKSEKLRNIAYTWVKYCGVAASEAVLEFILFFVLNLFMHHVYANIITIVFAATYMFFMNRNVTFKSSGNIWRSAVLFILLWIWNLVFSSLMQAYLPDMTGLHPNIVKLICMFCQGTWGFWLSRNVIFK